ncbi:RNA binding domain-containing protein [Salpingoeca rosetta]|uniref:RNA binding domain-containing protein n=1 Tax=Salpingoeca rosetta (strain ATCC 50818 / BSB-021) TaxID=946362 RepID=F2US96_SALR5|nr:RNA binding domain-containing protein [Salpingoeca rosetta]EGD81005.1 RNA binding domain-containing protein [Salpingoeca rosetta]|eukprot:XP_004987875.1 RNA binding domain-containing protein [Salpingoeca rosetta]
MTRAIERINEKELAGATKKSWHDDYKDSAYIFIGNLDYHLTEGDVLAVFSQYGEPTDINLVRDKVRGVRRGSFFSHVRVSVRVCLSGHLSASLSSLAGRTLRVDHVRDYEAPEIREMKRMQRKGKLHEHIEKQQEEVGDSDGPPTAPVREALLKELRGEGMVTGTGEVQERQQQQEGADDTQDDEYDLEAALKRQRKKAKKQAKKEKKKEKKEKKKRKKEKKEKHRRSKDEPGHVGSNDGSDSDNHSQDSKQQRATAQDSVPASTRRHDSPDAHSPRGGDDEHRHRQDRGAVRYEGRHRDRRVSSSRGRRSRSRDRSRGHDDGHRDRERERDRRHDRRDYRRRSRSRSPVRRR